MTGLLTDKVIAVTGAGSGLGRAYAESCAAEGAAVVVNDIAADSVRSVVDAITSAGGRAVGHTATVSSARGAAGVTEAAVSQLGRLDGLVANAGIKHEAAPHDEDERLLQRIWEVNVLGTQLCVRAALRHMLAQGTGGSIVTIVSGARFGIPGQGAYAATKGAVAALTATWALEMRTAGVRVNAVSPLAETAMAAQDHRSDRPHLGDPAAVAPLVVALLSDATAALTGEVLRFDGVQLSRYGPTPLVPLWNAGGTSGPPTARSLLDPLVAIVQECQG